METVIVTRHKGLIDWLKKKGITGKVIPHISSTDPVEIAYEILSLKEIVKRCLMWWHSYDGGRGYCDMERDIRNFVVKPLHNIKVVGVLPTFVAETLFKMGAKVYIINLPQVPKKKGELTAEDFGMLGVEILQVEKIKVVLKKPKDLF